MLDKIIFWFCEIFGKRDLQRDYLGNGNISEERGWWLFGKWVSAEHRLTPLQADAARPGEAEQLALPAAQLKHGS